MDEEQKKQLIRHMNQNDNDSYARHAQWATYTFGFVVTTEECSRLYMESLF